MINRTPVMAIYKIEKYDLKDHGTGIFLTGRANHERIKTIPEGFRFCSRCEDVKENKEFSESSNRIGGYDAYCKICKTEYNKGYREIHRQRLYRITPENIEFLKDCAKNWKRSEGWIVNWAIEKLRNGS